MPAQSESNTWSAVLAVLPMNWELLLSHVPVAMCLELCGK
jgi:hypothetical protein